MTCGIYKLVFSNTSKVYVGQSIHIEVRFRQHLYKLRTNRAAKLMQEAYKVYGEPIMEVLCTCSEDSLNTLEGQYIEKYGSLINGFNTLEVNHSSIGRICGQDHAFSKYSNNEVINAVFFILEHPELTQQNIASTLSISYGVIKAICKGELHKWLKDVIPEEYTLLLNKVGSRSYNSAEQ